MILFVSLLCIQHHIPSDHCICNSLYLASSACVVFMPLVAPHMQIMQYSPSEDITFEFISTNQQLLCYLVITSLFHVWNHSTVGLQIEEDNYLTNVYLLSRGGHEFLFTYISQMLFLRRPLLGDRKRLDWRKSFFHLFMNFPFNIHAFFQDYPCAVENLLLQRRLGPKIRFQLQWAQWIKESERDREGRNERAGFHVFSCKWEAGLEGDRLCLLLICQPVNGEKRRGEGRAEQLYREQSARAWKPQAINLVLDLLCLTVWQWHLYFTWTTINK